MGTRPGTSQVCGLSSHLRVLRVAGAASLTDKCAEGIALYCDQLEELDVSTTQMDVDKVARLLRLYIASIRSPEVWEKPFLWH